MGAKKASKYDILFEGLVKLLRNRQQQLEILIEERKMLEDRINTQHERWVSDVRLCKDHISQLNDALVEKNKEISLVSAKSDFMVGLKHTETSTLKLKLEQTEDELTDFKALFECLSHMEKNSIETDKEQEEGSQSNVNSSASKHLVNEVKRLKRENEKLFSEKDFIWNQYNVLERDLTDKLKIKESEIKLANNKIAKVLARGEKLQSSNDHKDEMVGSLRSKLAESETDRDKLKEEVSRLTNKLKSIEESINTPVLRRHNKHGDTEAKLPTRGAKSSLSKGRSVTVVKEIPSGKSSVPLKDGEKDSRSSKRKVLEEVCVLETPKLFSNSFKVPKLKTPSGYVT